MALRFPINISSLLQKNLGNLCQNKSYHIPETGKLKNIVNINTKKNTPTRKKPSVARDSMKKLERKVSKAVNSNH